jgi:hypothetical protein
MLLMSNRQHRTRCATHHAVRRRPKHGEVDCTTTADADDDEVDITLGGDSQDFLVWPPLRNDDVERSCGAFGN